MCSPFLLILPAVSPDVIRGPLSLPLAHVVEVVVLPPPRSPIIRLPSQHRE